MIDAIVAKMKLQSAIMPMGSSRGLIPALLGNTVVDAIVSGMYINPERCLVVDFVPYLIVGNQLLVAKGNPLHLAVLKPILCGHRLAAPVGTVFEKAAQAPVTSPAKRAAAPALTLISLESTVVSALVVKEGRADAIIASIADRRGVDP